MICFGLPFLRRFAVLLCLLWAWPAQAGHIRIAAAADLKFAMDAVLASFHKDHPADVVDVVYGSSGQFQTQIEQGAPYDLFFSADIAFPQALATAGLAASPVRAYAVGRIVLWSASQDASRMTLASLADPAIQRIAIANPKHAPYGRRAEAALRAAGLWQKVEAKLVYGENIAQAAQFVQTGNAQVGIIALSLALSPELASRGRYGTIPESLYPALEQGYILTRQARDNPLAGQFADYIGSPAARDILTRCGFVLPDRPAP